APLGRRFAPDPASGPVCTLGGMLANDASGARLLRYGYTRDHVLQMRLVLDNGDAATAGRELRVPAPGNSSGHLQDIAGATVALLEQHADLIKSCQPRTQYNRCGYLLHDVLTGLHLDLPRLLCGSEGTFGLITEATLRTVPVPAGRAVVMLGFETLDAALRAAQAALDSRPTACDLIDRRLISLVRGSEAASAAALVPAAAEAVLLIEFESDTSQGAKDAAN